LGAKRLVGYISRKSGTRSGSNVNAAARNIFGYRAGGAMSARNAGAGSLCAAGP
tara:strand:+ start:709 stop:870 length:162 start_codon:yes stop_codon:yes gene_type:complete